MERKFTIPDLSNEDYHNSPQWSGYVSSTDLKHYLCSPKAYRHARDNPEPETDAQRFGSLFHSLMESLAKAKGEWGKGYDAWKSTLALFDPPVNSKTGQSYGTATKTYAEVYQKFLEDNQGKEIIDEPTFGRITDMTHALLYDCGATSKQVRKLLRQAKDVETSYFYEMDDGMKLKIRPDLLTRNRVLVDWKTIVADSLDEDTIARQIIKYRYDVSMSMYQHGVHEFTGKWYRPCLVFVTKSAPYDAVIADISEWCYGYDKELDMMTMGVGAVEFDRLLSLHAKCTKENHWPGAETNIPEGDSAIRLKVPAWFDRKTFDND